MQFDGSECECVCLNLTDLSILQTCNSTIECTSLNLHCNSLQNVHGLPDMPRLVNLNLSSNALTSMRLPELSRLSHLVSLDMSTNCIETFDGMPFLPSLRQLCLSYNRLRSLSGLEDGAPHLCFLDVRDNCITFPDHLLPSLRACRSLRELRFGNNPVCAQLAKVSEIFAVCPSLSAVEGRGLDVWLDLERSHIQTPHFDRAKAAAMSNLRKMASVAVSDGQSPAPHISATSNPWASAAPALRGQLAMPVPEVVSPNDTCTISNSMFPAQVAAVHLLAVRLQTRGRTLSLEVAFSRWQRIATQSSSEALRCDLRELQTKLDVQQQEAQAILRAANDKRVLAERQAAAKLDSAQRRIMQLESDCAEARNEAESGVEAVRLLEQANDSHLTEIGRLTDACASLTAQVNELLTDLRAQQENAEQWRGKFEEQTAAQESLRENAMCLQNELLAKEAELTYTRLRLQSSEDTNKVLRSDLTSATAKMLQTETTEASARGSAARLTEELREVMESLESLRRESAEARFKATGEAEALRKEIAALRALAADNDLKTSEAAVLNEQKHKLESRLTKLHGAFETLDYQHSECVAENAALRERVVRQEKDIYDLKRSVNNLQEVLQQRKDEGCKRCGKFKQKLTEMNVEFGHMLAKNKQLADDLRISADRNNQLQVLHVKATEDSSATIQRLEKEKAAIAAVNEQLELRAAVKETMIADNLSAITRLNERVADGQAELSTLETSYFQLEMQLEDAQRTINSLQVQLQSKGETNEKLRGLLHDLSELNSPRSQRREFGNGSSSILEGDAFEGLDVSESLDLHSELQR